MPLRCRQSLSPTKRALCLYRHYLGRLIEPKKSEYNLYTEVFFLPSLTCTALAISFFWDCPLYLVSDTFVIVPVYLDLASGNKRTTHTRIHTQIGLVTDIVYIIILCSDIYCCLFDEVNGNYRI